MDLDKARMRLAALEAAALTYPEVGATASRPLPAGYRHVERRADLGQGPHVFRSASESLLSWQMHRRAGVGVFSAGSAPQRGAVVLLTAGMGPLHLRVACRVVYVVGEERRRGFAYGTLPGHPEIGEEAFVVELHDDDAVTLTIAAFSRPGSWYARLGGPLTRLAQDLITERYVHSLLPR